MAAVALAREGQDVVLMTSKGRVTKIPVKAIHPMGRPAAGYRTRKDNKEPYVDPAKQGEPALLSPLAGTKTAAKRARTRSATKKDSSGGSGSQKRKAPAKKPRSRTKKASRSSRSGRAKTAAGRSKGKATQMSLPLDAKPSKSSTGKR